MNLYISYSDEIGIVTVEVKGNVSFADGIAYFDDADDVSHKVDAQNVHEIFMGW